jgi:hypothetical protein
MDNFTFTLLYLKYVYQRVVYIIPPAENYLILFSTYDGNAQEFEAGISVGIAACYGLDGRGSILSRGKRFVFSPESRPARGSTRLLSHAYQGLFPWE